MVVAVAVGLALPALTSDDTSEADTRPLPTSPVPTSTVPPEPDETVDAVTAIDADTAPGDAEAAGILEPTPTGGDETPTPTSNGDPSPTPAGSNADRPVLDLSGLDFSVQGSDPPGCPSGMTFVIDHAASATTNGVSVCSLVGGTFDTEPADATVESACAAVQPELAVAYYDEWAEPVLTCGFWITEDGSYSLS